MESGEWLFEQLDKLIKESRDYKQKALLLSAKKLIIEQEKRKEQLRGELDGRLWSPGSWRE